MNATSAVSQTPIAPDPAQPSAAASVNSPQSGGRFQDFAATLSNAGAKPARKTGAYKPADAGPVGGPLPASGNVLPGPALPAAAGGTPASPPVPASRAAEGAAAPGATAILGAQTQNAPQNISSAAPSPPGAASADAPAPSPGREFALAAAIPVLDSAAPGVSNGIGSVIEASAAATATTALGAANHGAATSTEGIAAAANGTAVGAVAKPLSAAAATAALNAATSGSNEPDGGTNPPATASASPNNDATSPATSAPAASVAAAAVAAGDAGFAGADNPATPAASPMAAGRPNGVLSRVASPSITRSSAPAAPAGAIAQTGATLAHASAADKNAAGGNEFFLLSGGDLGVNAAGAAQLSVNSNGATDATPTPILQVSAGVETPEFGQGLADRVSWMVDNNLNGAKLQVNPPQLGPIEVQIAVQGGHAQIWLTSHSAVTRDALELSSPNLREMLGAQGFGQVSVDISQRSFQERSAHSQPYEWTPSAGRSPSTAAVQSISGSMPRIANGAVDAYA